MSSSTYVHRDSDEYLLKPDPFMRKSHPKRWSILRTLVYTALACVGCVELMVLVYFAQIQHKAPTKPLLGELNRLIPDFPVHPVLFRPDPLAASDHRTDESIQATRENWLSYMPRGNGFIAVNTTDRYTLPPPMKVLGRDVYSIAVFHQLHCLYSIMAVYDDLATGKSSGEDSMHSSRDSRQEQHSHGQSHVHDHNHVDHCFQYLRQSLLCCGDTALEGQDPRTDQPGTDGTGAVHLCKDFDGLMAWADGRRLVDNKHP
ncbi:hypothetical protein BDV26DRAFT_302396 [Aspergillus bertholletiae]|uniref:Uncharacterized protein n=1 Tax=Aspergillus bertholletiae TaxID=1226010 RepID=A0A5N7BGI5_9EURO|nr:hypothetical protein BDV26DRAFT_302396 [Aspergillus bertholletiae]